MTVRDRIEIDAAQDRLRLCSVAALAAGEDPAGSAWSAKRCFLIEVPLPWPYIFAEAKQFPPGLASYLLQIHHEKPEWGFVGIAPDPLYSREGWTRILDLSFPPSPCAAATRAEYLVRHGQEAAFMRALIENPTSVVTVPDVEVIDIPARDILVCTHGSIDACCARFGYPLYKQLRDIAEQTSGAVRVWRSTHFGGHRFAPTVLDLPEARYWGFLGEETGRELILRRGDPSVLRGCYRGWAGYVEPEVQLFEREPFMREGWPWVTWPQERTVLARDPEGDPSAVRITAYPPSGEPITYEGRIEHAGEVVTRMHTGAELTPRRQHQVVDLKRTP